MCVFYHDNNSPPSPQLSAAKFSLSELELKAHSLEDSLSGLRSHTTQMETQLAVAEEKQLSLEQTKRTLETVGAERLMDITDLQSQLEEMKAREGAVVELRRQLESLEEQLHRLEEEVGREERGRGGGREGGRERGREQ